MLILLLLLSLYLRHLGLCYSLGYLLFILKRLQKLGLNVYTRCVRSDSNCLLVISHGVAVTEGPSSTL